MGKTKQINNFWRHRNAKYCRECNCSVVGSQWLSHLSKKSHIDNARKRQNQSTTKRTTVVSVPDPTFRVSGLSTIEDQVSSFKVQVLMTNEECGRLESQIMEHLRPLLSNVFGCCQLLTFGSMKNGLAFIGSDLDVYVDVVDFEYSPSILSANHEMQSKVHLCSKALFSNSNFGDVNPIFDARVPIVTTMHIPTKTKCDISFTSSLGVEQARLLRYFLNLHQRFLDAMLVIKFWAKKQGICNGRDCISSYAWTLMFISYLQTLRWSDGVPIVPSVHEMQGDDADVKMVQDCRVDFKPKFSSVSLPDNRKEFSLLGLLTGFFTYYKRFSFRDDVLCPFLGSPISRYYQNPSGPIHVRILLHITALRTAAQGGGSKYLRIIQDPFNHKYLMVCPTESFPKVLSCIASAAELCEHYCAKNDHSRSEFLDLLFSVAV